MIYAVFKQSDVEKDGFKYPTVTYKIGRTKDFEARKKALQVSSHEKIEGVAVNVPDDKIMEKVMHMTFAPYRVRGEWFRLPPEQGKLLHATFNLFREAD